MDFSLPDPVETLRRKIRRFVDERLIPLESDRDSFDAHENLREEILREQRAAARAEGLWALSMPVELGGGGLNRVGMAACYEEMNRSIFGPACFNAAAPDDGNMWVLNQLGSEQQKRKWLQPLINGEIRSSLAMSEPAPGAGSDPAAMTLTRAEKGDDDVWRVRGRKWFITGAQGAALFILLARTSDTPRRELTAFLFPAHAKGWRIVRRIPIMGPEEHGGHCELEFTDLEIPDRDRLGDVGRGMKTVQTRLATARLTHCMRWLGLSRRALEIARDYVAQRQSFGIALAERESVRLMIADAAMGIRVGRLLVMHAAWKLDHGERAQSEVSAAKIHVADALHQAADVAIQLCGAKGYSKDTVLEWIYRYARQARLVDGASEVHKMIIADRLADDPDGAWEWGAKTPEI